MPTDKRKPPRRWTSREDSLLRDAIAKYEGTTIDWQEVANHLEGRTNKDCRKRWVYALRIEVTKGPWAQDEDERLEAGVKLHGCRWNKVSEVVGTRQADQCSRRWHECRNPIINRSRWSLLEDSILECAVRVYGRNWTEIVERFFYDRTPIAAKNRYKQRFEKGNGLSGGSDGSRVQDPQMALGDDEKEFPCMSPTSSTFDALDDGTQPFPMPWSGSRDMTGCCNFPPSYISSPATTLSAEPSLMSPLGTGSGMDSGFGSMEPSPARSFTDLPNGTIYAAQPARASISGNLYSDNGGFPTAPAPPHHQSRNHHMTISEIEEAFRELGAPPSLTAFGGNSGNANMNIDPALFPGQDYQSLIAGSSSGTPNMAGLPAVRSSLADSLALDQMIRQLASYRVNGVQGGEDLSSEMASGVFLDDQDLDSGGHAA